MPGLDLLLPRGRHLNANICPVVLIFSFIEQTCSKPIIPENGKLSDSSVKDSYKYSETLAITCDIGYAILMKPFYGPVTLQKGVTITCTERGLWNPDQSTFGCEGIP